MDQNVSQVQHVDVLVLPETNLILVASVIEPMRAANRIAGRPLYDWTIFSPDGAPIETKSGIPIPVSGIFRPQRETSPLFILSSYNWQRSATSQLKMLLSQTARHRELMAGIESGSWLLAETSLLDNFKATTHWEDFEDFTAAYPQVTMVRERFVIDGKRITTGGSLPTLDLMLELIRRAHGYSLALEVSRLFIYEQERTRGDLLQMPTIGNMRILDPRVGAAVKLMEETVEAPLTLARLARRIGVSTRHLQDLFRDTMGVAPHEHYLALRLNAARRKVIETRMEFADIAAISGFNSSSSFSRSYRAHYRESPSETRRRLKLKS
ncbi:GlxA family transcriptional regulator [Ensifer adhaerens]|uniref:GlxA family transcriptional regulator n=1 Tax=Ensifer TaxID=106591 RepID=UPI00095E9039|nr:MULTISPECIES: GlxA family transcriptional regulator [Ensifer]MBD9623901.1 GlxA family transcriptional regulator [Ensifer sp. ENS06]MBW0366502.1 GlxA family transcriptional regulator [Ensifer adhaerens]MCY1743673.1 GlxA family transcriptional regulator [Ensifer sp. SL37]MDF8355210.1 GlxA family transcriptional regulator [Ensifer adhaerens]OKP68958.1 AraC family transcriptional regulator [Ensifer adhaerens]